MGSGLAGNSDDEIDLLIEMILAVIMMCLSVFLIYNSILSFEERTKIYLKTDKVETSSYKDKDEYLEAFKFTGFQAFMFSRSINQFDHEPVAWTPDDSASEKRDSATANYVRIDPTGALSNFYVKRNNISQELGIRINNYWKKQYYVLNFTLNHAKSTDNHTASDENYYGIYDHNKAGVAKSTRYYMWTLEGTP